MQDSELKALSEEELDDVIKRSIDLYEEALEFGKAGDYASALDKYDESLELFPIGPTYINRGIALDKLGRYDEAIASFDEAIKCDPNDEMTYNARANALRSLGMQAQDPEVVQKYYEAAIVDYDRAIALKSNDAGYICNKVKVLQFLGRDREALETLNQAYKLIQSGEAEEEIGANADFVERTLAQRGDLLQKVIEMEQAAAEAEDWIAENGDEETKEEAIQLKAGRESIVAESLNIFVQAANSAEVDVASLMNALITISGQYEALKARVEATEVAVAEHEAEIKTLQLGQREMQALVRDLQKAGIQNNEKVMSFLAQMQSESFGEVPAEIASDPYKKMFYETLQRDLNAAYVAALSVQSDILEHDKQGDLLGNMSKILNIAGSYIPTIGGGVMLLGAMLKIVDQAQQDAVIARFANMATSISQMEHIVSEIAGMLVRDDFDKSVLGSSEGISGYMQRVFQQMAGSSSKAKKVASKKASEVLKEMDIADDESFAASTPKFKISSLIKFGKKKAAATSEYEQEEVKRSASDEKAKAQKDADKVAAVILMKIYEQDIFGEATSTQKAKIVVSKLVEHFDFDASLVEILAAENMSYDLVGAVHGYAVHHIEDHEIPDIVKMAGDIAEHG